MILDFNIVLNGGVSTAPKATFPLDLATGGLAAKEILAIKADWTAGDTAVTLQLNLDTSLATTEIGWIDHRGTDVRIRNSADGSLLAQTNGTWTTARTGIIAADGVYYLEFIPVRGFYRLQFELTAPTNIVINYVAHS